MSLYIRVAVSWRLCSIESPKPSHRIVSITTRERKIDETGEATTEVGVRPPYYNDVRQGVQGVSSLRTRLPTVPFTLIWFLFPPQSKGTLVTSTPSFHVWNAYIRPPSHPLTYDRVVGTRNLSRRQNSKKITLGRHLWRSSKRVLYKDELVNIYQFVLKTLV